MSNPTVDIIVPVWNNPFETRACLAAILEHSHDVRLIIVANGSNRETELMLEDFFEPLGDRALFLLSERNIGLVPAINRGLARSDSDYAVVVRPNVLVGDGWLDALLQAARAPEAGMVVPAFYGDGAPVIMPPVSGCSLQETVSLSFSTLLISGEMRMLIGGFDEALDGGTYCLFDYLCRAEQAGYRSYCCARPRLLCGAELSFGSLERRQITAEQSRTVVAERWGVPESWCLYAGKETAADELTGLLETLLQRARRGNRAVLLLHRRQYRDALKRGWNGLHTSITVEKLSLFAPERHAARRYEQLRIAEPSTIALRGVRSVPFPGVTDAPYWEDTAVQLPPAVQIPGTVSE